LFRCSAEAGGESREPERLVPIFHSALNRADDVPIGEPRVVLDLQDLVGDHPFDGLHCLVNVPLDGQGFDLAMLDQPEI
jgi:hypothetical protein